MYLCDTRGGDGLLVKFGEQIPRTLAIELGPENDFDLFQWTEGYTILKDREGLGVLDRDHRVEGSNVLTCFDEDS